MRRDRWMWGVVAGAAISGCGDSMKPAPLVIPSFVVVGDTGGFSQLYRVQDSVETRLSTLVGNDLDPMSAAGRLVFTTNPSGVTWPSAIILPFPSTLATTLAGALCFMPRKRRSFEKRVLCWTSSAPRRP